MLSKAEYEQEFDSRSIRENSVNGNTFFKDSVNSLASYVLGTSKLNSSGTHRATASQPDLDIIFSSLPIGVVVLDSEGIVRRANHAAQKLLGNTVICRQWQAIVETVFRPSQAPQADAILRNGCAVRVMTSALDDGSGQLVLLLNAPVEHDAEYPALQKKRLQFMDRMLASLAHQIRSPLSAAMLYATQKSNLHSQTENRQNIVASLRYIDRLINDILIFSRKGRITMSPIALSDLVKDLSILMQPVMTRYLCRVEIIVEDPGVVINGNHAALLSALQNLVENAAQACANNGDVRVRMYKPESDHVEILISDNGEGMNRGDQEKIFEPFYTNRENGTGLGLAIVDTVIKKHGAELWLESIPGKGTTFGLKFPLANENT